MKLVQIITLLAVAVFGSALLSWTPSSSAQDDQTAASLQGSWIVNATPAPISLCGQFQIAPAPPAFTELATYAAGGTLTETNTIVNANSAGLLPGLPFNGSDGHGAWERDETGYKAAFRKLVFDANGTYAGNADIKEKITVSISDPNKLSANFTVKFSFLNGAPSVCS